MISNQITRETLLLENPNDNMSAHACKFVLSTVTSGLCNRLKNIVSVMRIAEELGRVPVIYWPKNPAVYCDFDELFANQIRVISNEPELKRIYRSNSWVEYRHYPEKSAKVDYLIISSWRLLVSRKEVGAGFAQAVPSISGTDIDFEYQRIPAAVRLSFVDIVNRLEPVISIRNKIDDVAREFEEGTISVHIRSWVDAQNRSEQNFDFEAYSRLMDQYDSSQKFFISCDNESVLESMIGRYGSRVVYFPKQTVTGDRMSTIGIQEALVDLYLLSKNKTLITSYMSTFSEFAWWLGWCAADVHVIGGGGDIRENIMRSDRRKRRALIFKNTLYRPYLNLKQQLQRTVQSNESP